MQHARSCEHNHCTRIINGTLVKRFNMLEIQTYTGAQMFYEPFTFYNNYSPFPLGRPQNIWDTSGSFVPNTFPTECTAPGRDPMQRQESAPFPFCHAFMNFFQKISFTTSFRITNCRCVRTFRYQQIWFDFVNPSGAQMSIGRHIVIAHVHNGLWTDPDPKHGCA